MRGSGNGRDARAACLLAGSVLAACLLAVGAAAQHPGFGAPQPRPLHERMREADAVAIATVVAVEPGRIRVAEAEGVRGRVEPAFALKRAPSRPPPLDVGDRALLLLRGARSPYVLVDAPHEQLRLPKDADAASWSAALSELAAASSPARVYARWLSEGPAALQREAAIALADETTPATALAPVAALLADRALHARSAPLRRDAARAAVRTAEGRRRLLAGLPTDDPQVLAQALRAAQGTGADPARDALLRALRHASPEVRRTALRASMPFARDREVRAALVRIASEDPEASLRALARQIMKGPQRPTPDRPTADRGTAADIPHR